MNPLIPPVSELEGLRNLGPKSTMWLMEIGITTREQLARAGSIEACRRLREAGRPVSRLMAYAIEGALTDCDWRALPTDVRKELTEEFSILRSETRGM